MNKNTYRTYKASIKDYPVLMKVWESSVKATHYFLKEEDFNFYKQAIEKDYLPSADITCIKNESGEIMGFISASGDNLDMLFVHGDMRGKGIGKKLLYHAIEVLGITTVDVNEQNEQAVGFYKKFGFKTTGRNEYDDQGKPYPILHMSL